MILVPLFDLKFLNEPRRDCCRNFKSAALGRARAGGPVRAAVRERRGVETGKDKNGDSDPRESPEREKVMRGQHLMPRI